jgi:multicomponent Na+:H+ antiporter subunit F
MTALALAVLCAAALLFFARLVIGPSLPDRVIALDGVLGCVAAAIVVGAVRTDSGAAVDAVLVVTLIAFIGTAIAAQYVERKGG